MPLQQSLPTPNNPSASGITFYGHTTINRPAAEVWKTLLDIPSYSNWNTMTPYIKLATPLSPAATSPVPIQAGDSATLDVYLTGHEAKPKRIAVQATLVDVATFRLCWKGTMFPTWLLWNERVQELVDVSGGEGERKGAERGRCEYRNYETMAGPLCWIVGWLFGKTLDAAFQRCAKDLKAFVESG